MKAITSSIERYFGFLTPVIWRNVCTHILLNSCMIYTLTYAVVQAKFISTFIAWLWICAGYLSVTIGGHRLWSHRAFKATLPLRIFIMCIYTSTGMYSALQWARDHRVHHKYADTNADPHSSKRGLLYSHMGWLMMKRHPEHKEKGKLIDVSDVWADPVVRFQKKYFIPIVAVWFFIVPMYFFHFIMGESWTVTIFAYLLGRYCIILHLLGCINSLAHHFGSKPFNKNIQATQSKFNAFVTFGEGWHNFHHVFPWDYRLGEYGQGYQVGTYFINLFAWLGLAYDLKTASPEMVKRVLDKQRNLETNEEVPFSENLKVGKEEN